MFDNLSILYIEDNRASRKILSHILQNKLNIAHVTIFEDSEDVIKRAEAINPIPQIIFLDIHMEPLNGFEVFSLLRHSPRFIKTKILALTASVMHEEVEAIRNYGFDGCLSKPIDSTKMPKILERVVNGEEVWEI